jgi:hypothetical protein
MFVYAALAIAVYLSVPSVLWAVLILTTIGTIYRLDRHIQQNSP